MWAQGSQGGLQRLSVIKSDVEDLNQRWLKLIRDTSIHDTPLAMGQFRIPRAFASSCAGAGRPLLMEAARLGVPLFHVAELGTFCADLERVLREEKLPEPHNPADIHLRRLAEDRRGIAYAYLALLREIIRSEPVLATALFGIDESLLALERCSIKQLLMLSRADSLVLGARHAPSLAAQLHILQADSLSNTRRDVLRSWFLLTDQEEIKPPVKIAEQTLASDQLQTMLCISGLAALGCRLKVSVALTRARKPLVKSVMAAAGMAVDDKGGRRPSRVASLIETTSAHVASSFFLMNYMQARVRYGIYSAEPSSDAFLTALTMSRNTSQVTDLDPDLALLIAELFHQGEVSTCRCGTCDSTYLATTTPVLIRRDVVKGDCPICREVAAMETGRSRVVKLFGRKSRLHEILDQPAVEQTRLELD